MIYIWIGVFLVSLFIELSTTALVSVWFSAGSLVSLILAAFLGDKLIWLQVLVFVAITIACFILLRPVFMNKKKGSKTNVDAMVGAVARCVDPIKKFNPGTVKFKDLVWTGEVKQSDETEISSGDLVKILNVEGNKLIVEKYKEN